MSTPELHEVLVVLVDTHGRGTTITFHLGEDIAPGTTATWITYGIFVTGPAGDMTTRFEVRLHGDRRTATVLGVSRRSQVEYDKSHVDVRPTTIVARFPNTSLSLVDGCTLHAMCTVNGDDVAVQASVRVL